jgi:hypothetical protein
MSIGTVKASFMGGLTQETTLALANLNFDFALCKVEAPAEYRGLGECLSTRRRAAAESGNEHIFARKLGALFSYRLPAVPNLIRAYGKRATEIIREISNQEAKSTQRDGVFGEWTGPDATSIWAAATSGTGAIAAHLLACMLARMWTASEAQAVWEEIIEARKLEIGKSDTGVPFWESQELAAKIEATKDQIARWDSSARSWLEIADKSKMKQQKQLKLLVENIGIPVNQASTTYHSVMDAWTTALSTMEKLLEGIPQSINDGSVILALTSWHLFPDIFVVGGNSTMVSQHDPLYPKGSIITLGQSSRPPDVAGGGVFWSLPLAYLKYYGDPVIQTRMLGENTSRLTFSEVMQVVLGCMLACWGDYGCDLQHACANILSLRDLLSTNKRKEPGYPRSWVHLLGESAESYLSEADSTQSHLRSLTLRGHRRYKHLLCDPEQVHPGLFGLAKLDNVLCLCKEMRDKISLLRLCAQDLKSANHYTVLIRYRAPKRERPSNFYGSLLRINEEEGDIFDFSLPFDSTWEYATAIGRDQQPLSKKRKFTMGDDFTGHIRWTHQEEHRAKSGEEYIKIRLPVKATNSRSFLWDQHGPRTSRKSSQAQNQWVCILGDPDEAAIFKLSHVELSASGELSHERVDEILRSGLVDRKQLINLMEFSGQFWQPEPPQYLDCLQAFAAAAEAYKLMPGATISTDLFSAPLKDALWIPKQSQGPSISNPKEYSERNADGMEYLMCDSSGNSRLRSTAKIEDTPQGSGHESAHEDLKVYALSRNQVFSCIAMFENRKVNLDPRILNDVMAISAGGSIYVAMPLLCDPFDTVGPNEVKHITGNVSKPGVSLMIPPITPKLKKVDEDKWTMINHTAFNGRLDDSFQRTSLHLSFTGYQLPVMTAEHGYQGIEANFVESLVSVFDGHEWVGDLDILKSLALTSVLRISAHIHGCRHQKPHNTPNFPLTSIESWDEFMDRPPNACIFRASGNWLARLSAVALNAQQNLQTVVLEDMKSFCWECIGRMKIINEKDAKKRLLFIG